jgi:hypothetical protein
VGVVPEPTILEFGSFSSFHIRWSRGHTDIRVRCPTAILAPPRLGECRRDSHNRNAHHRYDPRAITKRSTILRVACTAMRSPPSLLRKRDSSAPPCYVTGLSV